TIRSPTPPSSAWIGSSPVSAISAASPASPKPERVSSHATCSFCFADHLDHIFSLGTGGVLDSVRLLDGKRHTNSGLRHIAGASADNGTSASFAPLPLSDAKTAGTTPAPSSKWHYLVRIAVREQPRSITIQLENCLLAQQAT